MLPHEQPASGAPAEFATFLRAALPRLEAERLVLRAPQIEDFQVYAEIAEGEGGRFLIDEPSREAAWFDFTQVVATWLLRGHGLWTVETHADARVVGFVLIGFEPGDHEAELGYLFRDDAQGQGYATEAAAAARDHAFDVMGFPTLVSTIDDENAASIRLAERLGASRDAAAEAAHDNAILVYRHPRPEAAA